MCDGGFFFAELCILDNADCQDYAMRAPKCDYEELAGLVPSGQEPRLGDGVCESTIYNTPECLFENGDCNECNDKVFNYTLTGDGMCHGGPHNTDTCNYDGGDCESFNEKWPKCIDKTAGMFPDKVKSVPIIGNGICDSSLYMNDECGYEDGECNACNELIDDVTKVSFFNNLFSSTLDFISMIFGKTHCIDSFRISLAMASVMDKVICQRLATLMVETVAIAMLLHQKCE